MLDKIYAIVDSNTLQPLVLNTKGRKYYDKKSNAKRVAKKAHFKPGEISIAEYRVIITGAEKVN